RRGLPPQISGTVRHGALPLHRFHKAPGFKDAHAIEDARQPGQRLDPAAHDQINRTAGGVCDIDQSLDVESATRCAGGAGWELVRNVCDFRPCPDIGRPPLEIGFAPPVDVQSARPSARNSLWTRPILLMACRSTWRGTSTNRLKFGVVLSTTPIARRPRMI